MSPLPSFETGQEHAQVVLSGDRAWLLGGSPDLRVVDIRQPTNLVLVATQNTGGVRLAAEGQYAYVASGVQGLQIYCLDCPRLTADLAGGQVRLKWPATATNYLLEAAASLPAQQWQPVSANPEITNGYFQVPLPPVGPAAFFRLRSP